MKILVASGSSGGHIFPALSFIDRLRLKDKDAEMLLVMPTNNILNAARPLGYNIKYVSILPVKLKFNLENIKAILKLINSSFKIIFLLIDFKPDLVVGFGSLISVPVVFFAWFFRINTLIHEQNVLPGRANRFLSLFSDRIAVSFIQTKNHFQVNKKRIVLTGNPLRSNLIRMDKHSAMDFFGLDYDKLTILVMGGSQGSSRINNEFSKFIFSSQDKINIQAIHLCGLADYLALKSIYQDLAISVKLFTFLDQMQYAYSAADIVISRSGATSLSELIYYKLPAVLIPYPYAHQHQLANAKILSQAGCGIIIDDQYLCSSLLKETIWPLIEDNNRLQEMKSGFAGFEDLDAARLLTQEALSIQ